LHAPVPLDEAPAVTDSARVVRLGNETAVLDEIERHRVAAGLSNTCLEQLAGPRMALGHATKLLGPSREKSPRLATVCRMLDALGLSIAIVPDAEKLARVQTRWRRRHEEKVRTRALSPVTVARARPAVVAALARRAAHPRWADVPARDFMRAMMIEGGA
jgi:hypothetical protein